MEVKKMSRAGAVIIKNNAVALIKRIHEDKTYYLFPGGHIENSENAEKACIREIKEELGLEIVIDRLIAEIYHQNDIQYYYLCNIVSGVFGTGTGEEYQSDKSQSAGIHEPVWMNITKLPSYDVRPACIYEIIVNGFPDCMRKFIDLGNGVCIHIS